MTLSESMRSRDTSQRAEISASSNYRVRARKESVKSLKNTPTAWQDQTPHGSRLVRPTTLVKPALRPRTYVPTSTVRVLYVVQPRTTGPTSHPFLPQCLV